MAFEAAAPALVDSQYRASNDLTNATSLLERTRELELIDQLFIRGSTRLLTLFGLAGVGKTRLALEVARRFGYTFLNGVRFFDLTDVHDPAKVRAALAEEFVRDSLLVLDNFEHVLSAAPVVESVLARSVRFHDPTLFIELHPPR